MNRDDIQIQLNQSTVALRAAAAKIDKLETEKQEILKEYLRLEGAVRVLTDLLNKETAK